MRRWCYLGWILFAPTAQAAEATPCGDKPNQAEMNICMAHQVAEADAALNSVYGSLHGKLDAVGRRNLIAAERAWIDFRDRECDLRTGYDTEHPDTNGTIAPFLQGDCHLTLTRQREGDLRALIRCPGGDLSCSP